MAHNTVWGLDIGNSAVKAVKMMRFGNEARIVDFDIIDIGGEEEGNRTERVKSALQTLCSHHGFGDDPVYLSLPGDQCLFREFQLPPGSEQKVEELVNYEAKQQIPFPLDQVEMGWERYDHPGGGVGVELIVVRKNIVDEVLALTDEFRMQVRGITVSPVAQVNFIQYEFQPQGISLILDAGYKGTDFVVMQGNYIYARTIPIGGREITRSLEAKFKVPYDKAEELKKNIEQSKQADKILSVIEPTLRQLGAEIQRTIGFYKSRSKGQRLAQGYLMGHTFRLPRMAETLAGQIREAPMTVVEGMQRIQVDRAVNPQVFCNEFPTMAVAIGLGVQGLGLSALKVNLLPKSRVRQMAVGKKKVWGVISAAAIILAVVASYFGASKERTASFQLSADVKGAVKLARKFEGEVEAAKKSMPAGQAIGDVEQRLRQWSRIPRDRGRMLQLFNNMVNLKDESGRQVFGPESKVFLTGLYVSRVPFSYEIGSLQPLNPSLSGSRREMLRTSVAQRGVNSIYAVLNGCPDPNALLNAFPELPTNVIISGECDAPALYTVLQNLEKALKKMEGVTGVWTDDRRPNAGVWREVVSKLDEDRKVRVGDGGGEAKVIDHPFSVFHVTVCYNPASDPDTTMSAAALAAPAAKADSKAAGKAKGKAQTKPARK
jgi:type IV pilus assembly protein PilM